MSNKFNWKWFNENKKYIYWKLLFRKKENFGKNTFVYDQYITGEYDYSIFSDSYGEKFTDHSFCAFSSIIYKKDINKNIYEGFIRPTCYEMNCSSLSLQLKLMINILFVQEVGVMLK